MEIEIFGSGEDLRRSKTREYPNWSSRGGIEEWWIGIEFIKRKTAVKRWQN